MSEEVKETQEEVAAQKAFSFETTLAIYLASNSFRQWFFTLASISLGEILVT